MSKKERKKLIAFLCEGFTHKDERRAYVESMNETQLRKAVRSWEIWLIDNDTE